jgi:hypothetical protein
VADLSREESKRLRAELAEEADHLHVRRRAVACACSPLPRVGGLVARKPIARRHRWEAVHLRQRRPRSPLAQRNRDHRKKEHQHDRHIGQRRARADRIREAHRRPVSATTAAELATAGLDRRRPRIRARLIWPSMAELHACFHLSQRRQAARDDAVFNELIARLDEEDDDSDG